MMKTTGFRAVRRVFLALLLGVGGACQAGFITSAFNGSTENFDSTTGLGGSNAPKAMNAAQCAVDNGVSEAFCNSFYGGVFSVGLTGTFTFDSGVEMALPNPNAVLLNQGVPSAAQILNQTEVFVGNFSLGGATFTVESGGSVGPGNNLPVFSGDSTNEGYVVVTSPAFNASTSEGIGRGVVRFKLPENVAKVGGYVTGTTLDVSVYDEDGLLVGGQANVLADTTLANWSNNFIGWEEPSNKIRYIEFKGKNMVVDNLKFAVPVPSVLLLLMSGMLFLVWVRNRCSGVFDKSCT